MLKSRKTRRWPLKGLWAALICICIAVSAPSAFAGSFAFGVLSYDVQIPASGPQAGVNVIQIQNLTGSASLTPDFPILTGLTLSDLTLTILTPGGSQILSLGALGPGSLAPNPSLQFASTVIIQSVTLAATFSPLTGLSIAGSPGSYAIANPNFLYVLSPSAGEELVAGVDIGLLEASADLTDVPEPATWAMILISSTGLLAVKRIRAQRGGSDPVMRRRRVSTQSLLCWLVGVFGSFGMAASQPAPQNPPATPSVSILQFTDPQCQACVAATEELNKLQQRYGASALTILAKPLAANAAEARALGIRTLPTLFVNGRRLEGPVDAASLGRFLDLAFGKLLADQPVALALEKAPVLASSANAAANSANVPEIVVFSDFQCPYCSSLAPQLAELAQGGEASIRFKHFPLSFHAKAPAAHRAALAAGQQGKFWEMHDRIFGAAGKLEPAAFEAYAKELDLDLSRFQQESAAGGAFDAAIQADIAEGERVGVEGTPTIFINGRQFLSKPTIANLRAALIESRKASGVLPQQAQPSQPTPLPLLTLLDGPAQLPAVEWFFDAHSQLTQASAAAVRRLLEQESRRSKSSGAGLRARVVARHMPMPFHSGSKLTHQALALASEQGKFWAFLDQVIAAVQQQQPAGAGSAEPLGADRLKSIAMRLGLDAAAFSQRLDQGAAAAAVERDLARARELSVRGVPAFVFDGKPLEGQSIDLESALASRSSAKALSTVSAAGGANTQ